MKRGKKKALILSETLGNVPATIRRDEYFARLRGKRSRAYMKFIAVKSARTRARNAQKVAA